MKTSNNNVLAIRNFQVSELEERVEFKNWSASAGAEYSENGGPMMTVGITRSF